MKIANFLYLQINNDYACFSNVRRDFFAQILSLAANSLNLVGHSSDSFRGKFHKLVNELVFC